MNDAEPSNLKIGRSRLVQIPLPGLAILCFTILASSALITYGLVHLTPKQGAELKADEAHTPINKVSSGTKPKETPAWGELVMSDIELEQPKEYAAFEVQDHPEPVWSFERQTSDQVRATLLQSGLPSTEVEHALSPELASSSPAGTIIKPDDALISCMSPGVRAKVYGQLARYKANLMMRFPWTFPGDTFDARFATNEVDESTRALVKKDLYPVGDVLCFSDYEAVLRQVKSEAERSRLIIALSRQSAVLARLRIRPDTDIDKVLGYWGRGARAKDLRPLLESLQRLHNGGAISLLYLLPPFVRERLYTFPVPSKPGDPAMDCHWSTLNFFNSEPDDHFADPNYTFSYLSTKYYQVAKPTLYGDIVLFVDENNEVVHSGVYLADDLVFTKNGNSFVQPWKVMRMKDLMSVYALAVPTKVLIYRDKHL